MGFWSRSDVRLILKYLWIISTIVLIVQAYSAYSTLPVRVATHFNASGVPDGWSSRKSFFITWYSLILGMNLIWLLTVIFAPRSLYSKYTWALSIPNRDYWLATDERKSECGRLINTVIYGSGVFVNLIFGIMFYETVRSNTMMGGRIRISGVLLTSALFLIFVLVYTLTAFRKSDE